MPQPRDSTTDPLVAVVVVSWNSLTDTLACLASAAASTYANIRLVVVDNASTDGSPEAVRTHFPGATLIALADNLCFTYAANRGIEAARDLGAGYTLLLNNDAVLDPECIARLAGAAAADRGVGIVCPKVLSMDDRTRIQYAGGTLSLITGRMRARGFGERDVGQYDKPAEVGFASGCCALIRREAVDAIGLLDESFYHGGEDLDFCLRLRNAGMRVLYEPTARAWHKLAASSGGYDSPFYVYYQARNRFLLLRKHATHRQFFSSLPYQIVHIARRAAGLAFARRGASLVALIHGLLDAARGLEGRSAVYPTPRAVENDSPGPPVVLIVNPVGVEAGGVQRILLELFRDVLPRGTYRFVVVVPQIGRYENEYQKLGVRVYAFPVSIIRRSMNPLTIARTAALFVPNVLLLRRIIRRHRIALVHTQKMNTLVGDVAARLSGVPCVHSLHEIPLAPRWLYQGLGAAIHRLADRVIVTCRSSREMIPGLAQDDPRVTTIYNGFDLAQVQADAGRAGAVRSELGIPDGMPLVGAGGRLSPSKGYEVFIEAACRLLREGVRARFLIIGDIIGAEDAPYKEKIRRLVRDLGLETDLILTGFRKDYHSVIAAMDVFALPSLYDTLPLMVIEAMALARPVVASAVGGVPEQVVEGRTGLLVHPGDPGALAGAIRNLLADPARARAMGNEGRRRAEEVFSRRTYVEATCRVYDELVRPGEGRR